MDPFEGIEVYSHRVFLSPYFGSPQKEVCRPETFQRVSGIIQQSIVAETTLDAQSRNGNRSRVFLHLLGRLRGQGLPAAEFLEEYLREKYRRNCRSGTLKNNFSGILPFLKYLKRHGKCTVDDIERRDVEAFIEHEQDRGLKVTSVRLRLLVLKAFFGYLKHRGAVADDVFPWKLKMRTPDALPRAMDRGDLRQLLNTEAGARERAMLLLLLRTGMRIGELLNITVDDVDFAERKILIYEGEKTRVGRVVYFTDDAREALEAWLAERNDRASGYLFEGRRGYPLTYSAARVAFRNHLERAGLSHKGYTLHCVRHTFATELLNAGMRLECLSRLMGHTGLEVTRRYARLSNRTREEEYFRAMDVIEREERHGPDPFDHRLQTFSQAEELLSTHGQELPGHAEAVRLVAASSS